ncbi:MAG: MFS transporter, partial [Candidatus Thermoplasmatota archaeon]|nr:MFS transporter [Candidatus Thermoplasmatota archaeon]
IMMLALFSIQLEGWFAPDERAKSLAFTLGAISLGSAAGGLLGVAFRSFSWQESYYITGVLMLVGAIIYFALAKDSPEQKKEFIQEEKVKHESAWKNPMTWVMGIIQIPLSWTLFSIGGYLSTYSRFLGYSISESGTLVIAWGLAGFAAAFIGAVLGDRLTRKTNTNMGILKARLKVMTLADVLMAVGIILMVALGHVSFYALLMAVIINGFLMMFPPNYWALPGNIFPFVIVTEGAFGMGLISNSADAIGPLVTSSIISTVGWTGVFMIMLGLAFLGIALNIFLAKSKIKVPEGKPE